MLFSKKLHRKLKKKAKSGLSAPKVDDVDIQRAIEKIYEDLNKLKDGTNKSIGTDSDEHDGNPGDIRVVKTKSKTYNLEVKGDDGWVTGILGDKPIQYKPIGSRKKYEPAELSEDGEVVEPPPSITSDNITDFTSDFLTISDLEPDFDTSWFDMANNDAAIDTRTFDTSNVGIESAPSHVQGWIKTSTAPGDGVSDGTHIYPWQQFKNDNWWHGIEWRFNANFTELQFWVHPSYYAFWTMHSNSHKHYNKVECRFKIWK
tara:strand:+ start:2387 stop:3163 length:777 start_codon:yes stop_codon:yes gene_type:complete